MTKKLIPRQKSLLQPTVSTFNPSQSLPPFSGVGLLHSRDLVWKPPPHVAEQELNSDHSLKPPSIYKNVTYKQYTNPNCNYGHLHTHTYTLIKLRSLAHTYYTFNTTTSCFRIWSKNST